MSGPIDRPLPWLALALVLEAVIFYVHVQLQVAPYYPQVYDQLTYMWVTTEILDNLSRHGFDALIQPFRQPMPTGITYPLQGALAQLVLGPGRAALLTVNLLYFLAAQFWVFLTVRRMHGAVSAAWLALALFIGCIGIFKTAGGIADYRIDFAAMCLFGIWVCTLSLTREFTSRKFSILAGLVAGALVLMRFITAAYLGPIFIILFCYLVFWKRRDEPDYFLRIANILISGLTAAVMALPALALALGPIKGYYVNGHINGDEPAIRAADVGVGNLGSNLLYYPKTLLDFQIGTVGAVLIVVALIVAVIGKLRSPNLRLGNSFDPFVFAVALLLPLAVLTCDYSKSPVVVGIVLIPLVLLIASIWYSFAIPHLGSAAIRWTTYFFLAVGAVSFVTNASSRRLDISSADQAEIQKLNLAIGAYCADLERPRIAFDRLTDYLNGATLRYYFRQQYGPTRPPPAFVESLAGIFTVQREQALSAIKSSDVVVLTDKTTGRGKGPFDTAIIAYWDAIDDFAEKNLAPLATGTVNGIPYRVFVRVVSPERKPE
jgi:MFS family permease